MASQPRQALVVDDDDAIRHVVVEALTDEGYAVREANNGKVALDLVTSWRPDVIVLDLMMPVMDGWTFRSHQRTLSHTLDVPVVVLSASRQAAEARESLGAAAVIPKPFDLGELLDVIAQALKVG